MPALKYYERDEDRMNKWISPYKGNCIWCKGAIHVHTANSHCGKLPPEQVIDNYGRKILEYDYISITDHDSFTDVGDSQGKQPLILIPGVENSMEMNHIVAVNVDKAHRLTADGFHVMIAVAKEKLREYFASDILKGLYNEIDKMVQRFVPNYDLALFSIWKFVETHLDGKQNKDFFQTCVDSLGKPDYQHIIDSIVQSGGIAILAHPHWLREDYWERDVLNGLDNYTGIEILNGDYVAPLTNIATDTWDRLLTMGKRVWGFGGDDFHNPNEFNRVWNAVNVQEKCKENIVESLIGGNFYVSTGVRLSEVKAEDDQIYVAVKDDSFSDRYDKIFRFIGREGKVLHTQMGKSPSAVYKARGDELYVRIHVIMETGQMAYTQPFFLEGE